MADNGSEKGRTGRWLRVLLFVSLALNLLVVGALAGMIVMGPPLPRGDRSDPALPYTRAFDEEQRRDLRRQLWRAMPRDRAVQRAAYLADYTRALDLLREDTFDRAALESLLADQAARGAEVRRRGQEVLMAYLSGMSAEERRAYADRLEEELEWMRHRGSRHHGRDAGEGRDGDRD